MATLLDYIAWRGDLSFANVPFNPVDGLILSQFAYVALDGLAPRRSEESRPLAETVNDLFANGQHLSQASHLWENNERLARAMAQAPRFSNLELTCCVSHTSLEEQTQFAALTYLLPDGTAVMAFRGTDDTLVGWKEDFNMTFDSPVPAQTFAAAYLQSVAEKISRPLRLMGHSKGGNLAVYATACAEPALQDRIISLINYDGPGMAQHIWEQPGYQRIRDRITIYLPHFAVVGMLMEHEDSYHLVRSQAQSIMQHDPFSWQLMGDHFETTDSPSTVSLTAARVAKAWLDTLTPQQRRLFVDTVYDIITAGGDEKLSQFDFNSLRAVIRKTRSLDGETRAAFHQTLMELFATVIKHLWK